MQGMHRRTDTKDVYPGRYDVWAGGCVAAGEDPVDAAHRELAEELGVTGVQLVPVETLRSVSVLLAFRHDGSLGDRAPGRGAPRGQL